MVVRERTFRYASRSSEIPIQTVVRQLTWLLGQNRVEFADGQARAHVGYHRFQICRPIRLPRQKKKNDETLRVIFRRKLHGDKGNLWNYGFLSLSRSKGILCFISKNLLANTVADFGRLFHFIKSQVPRSDGTLWWDSFRWTSQASVVYFICVG